MGCHRVNRVLNFMEDKISIQNRPDELECGAESNGVKWKPVVLFRVGAGASPGAGASLLGFTPILVTNLGKLDNP